MATEVKVKRWGNSMGIILPKSLIEERNLKEEDEIVIEVVKVADLSNIFGSIKKRKLSGQDAKDLMREGWEN